MPVPRLVVCNTISHAPRAFSAVTRTQAGAPALGRLPVYGGDHAITVAGSEQAVPLLFDSSFTQFGQATYGVIVTHYTIRYLTTRLITVTGHTGFYHFRPYRVTTPRTVPIPRVVVGCGNSRIVATVFL